MSSATISIYQYHCTVHKLKQKKEEGMKFLMARQKLHSAKSMSSFTGSFNQVEPGSGTYDVR